MTCPTDPGIGFPSDAVPRQQRGAATKAFPRFTRPFHVPFPRSRPEVAT